MEEELSLIQIWKKKIELEMEKQAEKVIYLQADAEVPTGQTVEIIGLAKGKPVEGYAWVNS